MDSLSQFHFIRPLWLLAFIPLGFLVYFLWQRKKQNTGLETFIDKKLLQHLRLGQSKTSSRLPLLCLYFIWFSCILALAGPTWKKLPQPVHNSESAVVIILDLSPSMLAQDIKPSRITRAHLKIQDFLSRRKEGLTALIVFSGEAFVVTPLTDDIKTIKNLLPTLKPGILPIPGSNTEMAVDLAIDLVKKSGMSSASLLLIADNINKAAMPHLRKSLDNSFQLSILGVGTDDGAPIPSNGNFLSDSNGKIIIAKRNSSQMQALANEVSGYYLPIQNTASDIDFYYENLNKKFNKNTVIDDENRNYDAWYESAPTLLLMLLPFIALSFRRGMILSVLIILPTAVGLSPKVAHASTLDFIWKNSDQRAADAYKNQIYSEAAENFNDPQWKGSALYKNKEYEAALKEFSLDDSAIGDYNRGNTLAQMQRYDAAISAYDDALSKDRNFDAAKRNKAIVEELKRQQEEEKEQENNQSDQNQEDNENNESNESQSSESESQEDGENQENNEPNSNERNENQESPTSEQPAANEDPQENTGSDLDEQDSSNSQQEVDARPDLDEEEKQALEQWLRKVPDDPSGLLKRKFEYEFNKRRQLYQEGKWQLPDNNAHNRY